MPGRLESCFLGQVILRKGILELMEAIQKMQGEPVHWTIVGGGESLLLERLRSLPQTTVAGPILRGEVTNYYRNADLFILPTHSDGFAITQLEALAHGLPIVASNHCGEVIQHGVNGELLDNVASAEIVRTVRGFLGEPDKLLTYSRNTLTENSFTLEDLGKRMTEIAVS